MQLVVQLLTTLAVAAFAFGVTFVIAKLLKGWMGLRVSASEEQVGLDLSEHGERAYS
jgi:Amt family ammonium transporter